MFLQPSTDVAFAWMILYQLNELVQIYVNRQYLLAVKHRFIPLSSQDIDLAIIIQSSTAML
jgi:hypothetical protein